MQAAVASVAVPHGSSHHTSTWCPGQRPILQTLQLIVNTPRDCGHVRLQHSAADGKRKLRAPSAIICPTVNSKSRKPELAGANSGQPGDGTGDRSAKTGPS